MASGAGERSDHADTAETTSELRALEIGMAQHGQRLDRALVALLPEFSRNYIRQCIEAGDVVLQGQSMRKPAAAVQAGQRGSIELRPSMQSQSFRAEPMALTVVFEDEHLRVIDKPVGLVVHPAPGHWGGTLLNGLLALDSKAALVPRAGIVHRLDRDTSGLMVVARTRAAMDALVAAIAARRVSRQYVALAHGAWRGETKRWVDAAIGRDPRNRLRMAVVDTDRQAGKPARTLIELLTSADGACTVQCTLETGRTHQIRVHMAALGHPLVGDQLYGGKGITGLERQALHAQRLAFVHPVTGEQMDFEAPIPGDMLAGSAHWGLHYN